MPISKFVEAVRNKDTSELCASDRRLADSLLQTLDQISIEFHSEIFDLLERILNVNDFSHLLTTLIGLRREYLVPFIAYATGNTEATFLDEELNRNKDLQRAFEIAAEAYWSPLRDDINNLREQRESHEEEDTNS